MANNLPGLEAIQLHTRVLEWLELVMGQEHPESEVVHAFLEVMSQMEFTLRDALCATFNLKQIQPAEPPIYQSESCFETLELTEISSSP